MTISLLSSGDRTPLLDHVRPAREKKPILDKQALYALHELSFNIPRKIGAITEPALTYTMFDQKRNVTQEMVLRSKDLEG